MITDDQIEAGARALALRFYLVGLPQPLEHFSFSQQQDFRAKAKAVLEAVNSRDSVLIPVAVPVTCLTQTQTKENTLMSEESYTCTVAKDGDRIIVYVNRSYEAKMGNRTVRSLSTGHAILTPTQARQFSASLLEAANSVKEG